MFCFVLHGGLGYLSVKVYVEMFLNVVTLTTDLVKSELNQLAEKWRKKTIPRLT